MLLEKMMLKFNKAMLRFSTLFALNMSCFPNYILFGQFVQHHNHLMWLTTASSLWNVISSSEKLVKMQTIDEEDVALSDCGLVS